MLLNIKYKKSFIFYLKIKKIKFNRMKFNKMKGTEYTVNYSQLIVVMRRINTVLNHLKFNR